MKKGQKKKDLTLHCKNKKSPNIIKKPTLKISEHQLRRTNLYRCKSTIHVNLRKQKMNNTIKKLHICLTNKSQISLNYTFSEQINLNIQRLCLSKPQRKLYDIQMNIKKYKTPQEIISKNQIAFDKNQFTTNQFTKELCLRKKFRLKNLTTNIIKDLNPLKNVRIGDYVFPLDSSVLSTSNTKDVAVLYNFFHIKKAVDLTYKSKNSMYTIRLEERFQDYENLKGLNTLEYFIEWLNSLGDMYAIKLSQSVELFMKNLYKSDHITSLIIQSKGAAKIKSSQKLYLTTQLSEQTIQFMSQMPLLIRYHKVDISSNQGTMTKLKINKKWEDIVGVKIS